VCIGPGKSAKSYLDIPSVVSARDPPTLNPSIRLRIPERKRGFRRSMPGFRDQIHWTGPAVIRSMGVKDCARAIMRDAGVRFCPGSGGVLSSAEEAVE